MDIDLATRIRSDEEFLELERRRTGFGWTLTFIMLGIYYAFILLVAFLPKVMATPISGVITLGFPLGLGVIVSAIVLTGLYVWRANTVFDPMTRRIVEKMR